jgi:hypothetical protein
MANQFNISTAAKVRRHVYQLKPGEIVTRKDLIVYGTEGAVDNIIQVLLKKGCLVRAVWGVYARPDPKLIHPTFEEIVEARVRTLGRQVLKHHKDLAHEHGLVPAGNGSKAYLVDGARSSFVVRPIYNREGCIVQLIKKPARKLIIDSKPPGIAALILWFLTRRGCSEDDVRKVFARLTRTEKEQFLEARRWMPGWLSDLVYDLLVNDVYRPPTGPALGHKFVVPETFWGTKIKKA